MNLFTENVCRFYCLANQGNNIKNEEGLGNYRELYSRFTGSNMGHSEVKSTTKPRRLETGAPPPLVTQRTEFWDELYLVD